MTLDPDAAQVLELIRTAGRPPVEALSPDEARASYRAAREAVAPEPVAVAEVRDLAAEGPHGPIPLRLYRPHGVAGAGGGVPALVYFHGGGWVLGDLDSHDGVCRHIADRSGCVVIAVDYRLAPEHKFPAAVEDAFAATRWVAAHAQALGLDAARLAVAGDSAGGNLAAVVCLLTRDAAEARPRIAFQMLLYPATDFAMDTPSHRRFAEGHLLTGASMRWFRDHYLRTPADQEDWRASPLRAPSLVGLPPAYVLTASHDPLRDEGEHYTRRLIEAGVPVTVWRVPGQIHGFLPMGRLIATSSRALDALGAALKAAMLAASARPAGPPG